MSKDNNDYSDFTQQLKKIKREVPGNQPSVQQIDSHTMEILTIIKPVIKAFVDVDSLLEIQSSPPRLNGFHIVYANTLTYRIVVRRVEQKVDVEAFFSSGGYLTHDLLYSGSVDQKSIVEAVKKSLVS